MALEITDLLEKYAAPSIDKQYAFEVVTDVSRWSFDADAGTIQFADGQVFSVQVMGIEDLGSNTWTWAWADEENDLPENSTEWSRVLRDYGSRHNIRGFTVPQLNLTELGGHILSIIGSGICEAVAYFQASYEGGSVFLLIEPGADMPEPEPETSSLRVLGVFSKIVQTFRVNNRRAFMAYMEYKGYPYKANQYSVRAQTPYGEDILASFGSQDRLTYIKALPRAL